MTDELPIEERAKVEKEYYRGKVIILTKANKNSEHDSEIEKANENFHFWRGVEWAVKELRGDEK